MKNHRLGITTLAILFAIFGVALARGSEEHADVSIQGEILDMACYVAHEAKGPDHTACALKCVKEGQPMGLLAEDGSVYLLYASHKDGSGFEKAKEFAGKMVVITGKKSTRGGIAGIEVDSVKPS